MTNLETTQNIHQTAVKGTPTSASFFKQLFLLTWRTLVTIFRTPESILPPIAISLFFLVIYESTLGKAAGFGQPLRGRIEIPDARDGNDLGSGWRLEHFELVHGGYLSSSSSASSSGGSM